MLQCIGVQLDGLNTPDKLKIEIDNGAMSSQKAIAGPFAFMFTSSVPTGTKELSLDEAFLDASRARTRWESQLTTLGHSAEARVTWAARLAMKCQKVSLSNVVPTLQTRLNEIPNANTVEGLAVMYH
jgi:hypothetical protein